MDHQDVDALDSRINRLGSKLFFDPVTTAYAASQGIDNVFLLYSGRAGVMGDVTAAQVASAFCFFEAGVVQDVMDGLASSGLALSQVGAVFATGMSTAANSKWDAAASQTVAAIGKKVIASVVPSGMALFAGWKQFAEGGDPACTVHALRELRGDIHIQSVAAEGLHPLEAEMVTRGIPGAQMHGWKPPYPDPALFAERVATASGRTSKRMADIYSGSLTATEFSDLQAAVIALEPATT